MNVLTSSGYKKVSQLKKGDVLIGKNGVLNTVEGIRHFNREWYNEQKLSHEWKWYVINGKYKFFHNQNIFVAEGDYGVCHISELKIGWKIWDKDNNLIEISSIEEGKKDKVYWKLDVSGDHSYIGDGVLLHNASRYWVGGGSSTNWNATANTNWGTASGVADNASVPGSSDDVTFDGAGGGNGNSVISATISILTLTITAGYTATMTHNAVLTITTSVTLNTGYTIAGSSSLTLSGTGTITSNGKNWPNNVTFQNFATKTLSGDWTIVGTLSISGSNIRINKTTSEVLYIGGLTCNGTVTSSSTCTVEMTGGTWSSAGSAFRCNLRLAGNITISGTVLYETNTLTYVSGTVTTTSSTLSIGASCTLDTNGITWNNITISANATLTLNSLLIATGTLDQGLAIVTYAGTSGWTVGTFNINQTAMSTAATLKNSTTYTITSSITCFKSRVGSIVTITSDHASNKAILTLHSGAECNVLANFTRIDASGGRPIRTFNGTVTTCSNIVSYTDIPTIGIIG